MNNQHTLTIQSLVYEGFGLSRLPDGKAVFVPYVLPGEQVTVRIQEEKQHHALAELIRVDEPGKDRIVPRCAHFGTCGGCHYQHIPYKQQLAYKKEIFKEQLQRIAHFDAPVIENLIPSSIEWHYRNALQFQVSPQGNLCFADEQTNALFAVRECHLPMTAIDEFWRQLEFEPGSYRGRLEIRQNHQDEIMLALESAGDSLPELESEASISIVSTGANGVVVLAGEDTLNMQVGGRSFQVSASSFFQTNFSGALALAEETRKMVIDRGCRKLMDVYCGVGLFSAFLAENVDELVGIESSPSACQDFAVNLDAYDHVSLYQGTAESVLPALDFKPDMVLADPPRAGIHPQALQSLLKFNPKTILYISCNPSTLARDARKIHQAGYNLKKSVLVDMFPQTFHIESINLFSRS